MAIMGSTSFSYQRPDSSIEGKLLRTFSSSGALSGYRVLAEKYIDERRFDVNTFILPQNKSVMTYRLRGDGEVRILATVFSDVYPVFSHYHLSGSCDCWDKPKCQSA
jgi:hypothetical protein